MVQRYQRGKEEEEEEEEEGEKETGSIWLHAVETWLAGGEMGPSR